MEVNLASAWPLLRAALDLLILGASSPEPANYDQLQLLLALLNTSQKEADGENVLSGTKNEASKQSPTKKENKIDFQKPNFNVESEFKNNGFKMPKGIIIKEETNEDNLIEDKIFQKPVLRLSSEINHSASEVAKKPPKSSTVKKRYNKKIKKGDPLYQCKLCDFQTNVQSKLSKHKIYKHIGRTVLCDQCDKKYFFSSHLKEHINSVHSTSGLLSCSACTYTTVGEKNLKAHFNLHHGVKNILCTECSFTTTHEYRLREHVKKDHTDEENWPKCPKADCGYKNWEASAVKNHFVKVHEGVKFKCEICTNEFSEKANMHAHMLKVHKELLLKADNSRTSAPFHEKYTFRI